MSLWKPKYPYICAIDSETTATGNQRLRITPSGVFNNSLIVLSPVVSEPSNGASLLGFTSATHRLLDQAVALLRAGKWFFVRGLFLSFLFTILMVVTFFCSFFWYMRLTNSQEQKLMLIAQEQRLQNNHIEHGLRLLNDKFPEEQSCVDYLEKLRWARGLVSPFDPESKVYVCKGNRYRCKNTWKYFNVRTRTMFESSNLSLRTWFFAIYLYQNKISGHSVSRILNITQSTAWRIKDRLKKEDELTNLLITSLIWYNLFILPS